MFQYNELNIIGLVDVYKEFKIKKRKKFKIFKALPLSYQICTV